MKNQPKRKNLDLIAEISDGKGIRSVKIWKYCNTAKKNAKNAALAVQYLVRGKHCRFNSSGLNEDGTRFGIELFAVEKPMCEAVAAFLNIPFETVRKQFTEQAEKIAEEKHINIER